MILPAWQSPDSSDSQEPQQKNMGSSTSPQQLFTQAMPTGKMSPSQILSYLAPHISNSEDVKYADFYDTLREDTASADPALKKSIEDFNIVDKEEINVIFPEVFKAKTYQNTFTSLQKWEGVVLELTKDIFLARLIDITNTGPDEEAEFSIDEISEEDKPLVKPGAIFYWNIGYHTSYSGQRTRISIIRFRRLPAWTQREIDAAKREAEHIGKELGWQ